MPCAAAARAGHEHRRVHEPHPRLRRGQGRPRLQEHQMILVDTCVLVDVIEEDALWSGWSQSTLEEWGRRGPRLHQPGRLCRVVARFRRSRRAGWPARQDRHRVSRDSP
ncbi:MAG: hypothetical protein M5R42_11225 [Rhodocyclaceae bacterium]|nr:hypothetical protein [Rhodocyclaceae bacterium]